MAPTAVPESAEDEYAGFAKDWIRCIGLDYTIGNWIQVSVYD